VVQFENLGRGIWQLLWVSYLLVIQQTVRNEWFSNSDLRILYFAHVRDHI